MTRDVTNDDGCDTTPMSSVAQLHLLSLPENPFEKYEDDKEYKWLKYDWLLEDPQMKNEKGKNDSKQQHKQRQKQINPGDVIAFTTLNTGSGEFECLRFVGKERRKKDGYWLILDGSTDVELPCFPEEIIDLVIEEHNNNQQATTASSSVNTAKTATTTDDDNNNNNNNNNCNIAILLKMKYKSALDQLVDHVASCTLEDIVGEEDEFWKEPPTTSKKKRKKPSSSSSLNGCKSQKEEETKTQWIIPYLVASIE